MNRCINYLQRLSKEGSAQCGVTGDHTNFVTCGSARVYGTRAAVSEGDEVEDW